MSEQHGELLGRAFVPGIEVHHDHRPVRPGTVQQAEAVHQDGLGDAWKRQELFVDAGGHDLGPLERCGIGQLEVDEEITVVLKRDKPGGDDAGQAC